MPLVSLGGFILITGFMAFNGGSQGSISRPGDGDAVGRAILATMVACGSSGMVVLLTNKFLVGGTWSLPAIVNGCITGMVFVSGGCDGYHPLVAALIGLVSGPSYLGISRLMVHLQIDDPVDAVAIHL